MVHVIQLAAILFFTRPMSMKKILHLPPSIRMGEQRLQADYHASLIKSLLDKTCLKN
jgi:hypothetical protein